MEWHELASEFFKEYVKVNPQYLRSDGTMIYPAMKGAAKMLLFEGVFDSVSEMKEAALMDYGIILPDDLFSEVKKNDF